MPHLQWIYLSGAFVLGAIVGSFLNVCIWRLPRELSLVFPGSACPQCRSPIRWFDNVPILSYLWLAGKCRDCKVRIPLRYWGVEILTSGLFLYLYRLSLADPGERDLGALLPQMLLVSALIIATFVDFEWRIIPDEITKTGMFAGPALSAIYPPMQEQIGFAGLLGGRRPAEGTMEAVAASLLGICAGAGMIWILGWAGRKIFRKEAMGFGDVKLMGMVGAFLGWQSAFLAFWIAPVLGLAYGLVQKIRTGDPYMPYGPFLSIATFLVMVWRSQIMKFVTQGYPELLRGWIGGGVT